MISPIEVFPGAWHFPSAISFLEQKKLIHLFKNLQQDLYVPSTKYGKMNLQMNCLGWHWNAIDYKYYKVRNDVDGKSVERVPESLSGLGSRYSSYIFPYHNPIWDICICNFYIPGATLGMHRDNSESERALSLGHPVVSISIGATCTFRVGGLTRNAPQKDVLLKSGDVFIFGEDARLCYHGVPKIHQDGKIPFGKSLNNGRINFTLRKM